MSQTNLQSHDVMRCTWCHREDLTITQDHVLPRSIGGTLQYAVPACSNCQTILSKAERDLSRKSLLAIHALSIQGSPRHPKRPTSGLLQAGCLLVEHPLGGYGESVLRAGQKLQALSHVEIKVVPGEPVEARVRGPSWEESERIFSGFKSVLANVPGPDGLVCEINVSLEVPPSVAEDPDFWPRMILLPDGKLMIRARNPDEAKRLGLAMTQLVLNAPPRSPSTWTSSEIKGGTTHQLMIQCEPNSVRRIVAKIAYGVFHCIAGLEMPKGDDIRLRHYILGNSVPGYEPVSESPTPDQTTTDTAFHFVALAPEHDRQAAIVCLYRNSFRVQIGSAGTALPKPILLLCATDRSGMRLATTDEAESILKGLESLTWIAPSSSTE